MTDISGKRVLITGGAGGIGRKLADKLAQGGAGIVLWDIDADGLERAQVELSGAGFSVDTYTCDLTNREEIKAVAAQTLAASGAIDILVNNAGVVSGKHLLELSEAEIERTFQVNALALFWTVRAFLPGMLERDEGHIVTIASAAGLAGTARLTDYCASKFAAVGFDESLRLELRQMDSNVMTTVVCPFFVDTGMFGGARTRFSWLLPILNPDSVVKRTVKAIRQDRRRLLMPWFMYTSGLSRMLPVSWYDGLMAFLGVSRSMDEFHGGPGSETPKS